MYFQLGRKRSNGLQIYFALHPDTSQTTPSVCVCVCVCVYIYIY